MWTCAGGCRRAAGRSASRRRRSSGTTIARRVKAYWRQQVGYGEGETWLMAHHPGQIPRRAHAVARPHLQPAAVRAIALGHAHQRRRLGHGGVSVGLPHRRPPVRVPAAFDQVAGAVVRAGDRGRARFWRPVSTTGRSRCCSARVWSASRCTIAKNVAYALRSDVDSLPGSRLWYRAIGRVSALHPADRAAARAHPRHAVAAGSGAAAGEPQTSRGPRPSLKEAWRALLLISGSVTEDRYWSENWTSADRVLAKVTDWLRRSRAVRTIEIDEGWSDDRDVSVFVGRWAWLDIRALVEDHGGGKGCCASARTCARRRSAS